MTSAAEGWANLVEEAPFGLLLLDAAHGIDFANSYAVEVTGLTREILCSRQFHSLLTVAGRIFVQTRLWPELVLAGRVEELALDFVRPDGERIPVLLNASQSPAGIQIAFSRAAAKRAYEAEVPKARLAAQSAARVKSDFLANISHEIRTPLNGVIGIAGALERTELTGGQREMLTLIQTSGRLLEQLVSDILDVSKVEAGGLELEPRAFDLQQEFGGVLNLARFRAQEKGIGFHARFGAGANGCFHGDAMRLKQVLGNLAANAMKFTKAGEVRVEVDVVDAQLIMTVEDTGIGFDETVGDTLFQRFHQVDASITRRYGGTGLGLAICKALVDLMGGVIEARSSPGQGSWFQVRAPLAACEPAQPERPVDPVEPDSLRVLLVEDHPANQKVVELILAPYGVELTIADDGLAGLEAWRRGEFDLILMDMQMPVMDGLTATRTIRSEERAGTARTPIAVLSANAMDHHRQEALAAGADIHIAKPITRDKMLAGIQRALDANDAALAA